MMWVNRPGSPSHTRIKEFVDRIEVLCRNMQLPEYAERIGSPFNVDVGSDIAVTRDNELYLKVCGDSDHEIEKARMLACLLNNILWLIERLKELEFIFDNYVDYDALYKSLNAQTLVAPTEGP